MILSECRPSSALVYVVFLHKYMQLAKGTLTFIISIAFLPVGSLILN